MGAKMPAGTPDQTVSQVATYLKATKAGATSDEPSSMARVATVPLPNVAPWLAMPMAATSKPQTAANSTGRPVRQADSLPSGLPRADASSSRANRPPATPATRVTSKPGMASARPMGPGWMMPKWVALPWIDTAIMPASTMPATIRPLLRCSGERDSSSMANMTPASGVLKAAAMPAAPPATSREWALTCEWRGSQRRAASITPAAICTDGPSRPSDKPPSKPPAVRTIFAALSFRETNSERCSGATAGSSVAITCGMPEPAAPMA